MRKTFTIRALLNPFGQLLTLYTLLYAAGLIMFLTLYALSGNRIGFIGLAGNFLEWLLLPTLILLPLMLWKRRWFAAALVGINATIFVILFGGQFLPNFGISIARADSGNKTLTIMTYNTNSNNVRLDELLDTLREADADVVGLQELGSSAAAIQSELQDVYPYQALYGYGTQGVGILSRYPIVSHEFVEGETAFPYLAATLDVDGHLLTVISAHPPSPGHNFVHGVYYSRGINDVPSLTAQAGKDGPTLLLVDLNATPHSQEYGLLRNAGLTDSFQEAGWGFGNTFPAEPDFPLVRIDYIWHTDEFRTTEVWVGSNGGSDHLPVYAKLVWQYGL